MNPESKVDKLVLLLRKRVDTMPDGASFPSVRQLVEEYAVSQSTVVAGLKKMVGLGLLESVARSGFFVRRRAEGESPTILILTVNWPSLGNADMIVQLRKECEKRGYRSRLEYYESHDEIASYLKDSTADAIVLEGLGGRPLTPEMVFNIDHCCVPVIISRGSVRVGVLHYVDGNNAAGGVAAANFLYQSGHRRLGVLYSEPHSVGVDDRVNHFAHCAETNGCRVEVFDCDVRWGEMSSEKARAYVAAHFRRGDPDITALFAVSDGTAVGAMQALAEAGLRVPEDLSVLGFGNSSTDPAITTVHTPRNEMAAHILTMIDNILARRTGYPTQIEIPPRLVVRDTVRTLTLPDRSASRPENSKDAPVASLSLAPSASAWLLSGVGSGTGGD